MAGIDLGESTFVVRTRAKGLLARLAHDLELRAARFEGTVALAEDASWSAELRFPVNELKVAGTLRGDVVDTAVLSGSDRAEIERRVREDVLPVALVEVGVRGSSRESGEAVVRVGPKEQRVRFTMKSAGERDAIEGRLTLSLAALGVGEIKGPLGAFKVSDAIEVLFRVRLASD
jgi:hypothetical protein